MPIIINAGGSGTRLWPVSIEALPKQFAPLVGERSLIQETYKRLRQSFQVDQIFVATNSRFSDLVRTQIPELPASNLLLEPEKRDSFAAVAAHSAVVASIFGKDVPQLFVNADHLIPESHWPAFNQALQAMLDEVAQNTFQIVLSGIKPSRPSSQLGYIEFNPKDKDRIFSKVLPLQSFKEKPSVEVASDYLKKGNFLWNLGYFGFQFFTLEKIMSELWPAENQICQTIFQNPKVLAEVFSGFTKISFDYAILEKIQSLGVIGMDISWEDIGSWQVMSQYLPQITQEDANLFQIAGSGNQVKITSLEGRKIAFVGVSNLILAESPEGIMIINPEYSGEVKKVVEYFACKK